MVLIDLRNVLLLLLLASVESCDCDVGDVGAVVMNLFRLLDVLGTMCIEFEISCHCSIKSRVDEDAESSGTSVFAVHRLSVLRMS